MTGGDRMLDESNESQAYWLQIFCGIVIGRCILMATGILP